MSRQLAEAHIRAQKRLRDAAVRAVSTAWQQLPAYNEQDVPQFLNRAVPAVTAAQRQSALVTNAYLARAIRRPVAPLDVAAVTGPAVRAGTPPEEVYRRPFVTVWTSLKAGNQLEDAIAAGLARAAGSAAMDVQLTMRATLQDVGMREDRILGYARVPDGDACNFCQLISGQRYTTEDLLPVHNHCGCSVEVITAETRDQFFGVPENDVNDTVQVAEHGELGPLLVGADHHFTAL